jgi:nucleoside-diphosphate-sugar epimerase
MDVLLGATGFVGGNLQQQASFDRHYHSRNIDELAGAACRRVVCAAAPAAKWKANQEPEADRANLARLMGVLRQITAEEFILVSTVDVFGTPLGVDEASPVDPGQATAYGRHRFELEEFVRSRFTQRCLVVRLPGLFGQGLKKNIIFDFLHNNQVQNIDARSAFQFYDLGRLWADIETALGGGLELVHFATEPVTVRDVALAVLGRPFNQTLDSPPARYDFRTCHASLFGQRGPYLQSRAQVLTHLTRFVAQFRGVRQCA